MTAPTAQVAAAHYAQLRAERARWDAETLL